MSARRLRAVWLAVALAIPAAASAQPYLSTGAPHRGSTEFSAAAVWTRGYDGGDTSALETRNTTTGTGPLTLFTVGGSVSSGAGVEGRVGLFLTSRLSAEALFQYTRPVLHAAIADDFEGATAVDAKETVSSYLVGGSLLYHFGSGRFMPFVSGGAGYLRQLHEASSETVKGAEVHGGAGFKFWFGGGARRFGLRVDALASSRSKSVGFEDARRIVPTITGGISYVF
jgi:hypothetical protein